jgi:hypothetical protein
MDGRVFIEIFSLIYKRVITCLESVSIRQMLQSQRIVIGTGEIVVEVDSPVDEVDSSVADVDSLIAKVDSHAADPMYRYNVRLTQLFAKYKYIWLWLQCFDPYLGHRQAYIVNIVAKAKYNTW